jgi:hypothetical protein
MSPGVSSVSGTLIFVLVILLIGRRQILKPGQKIPKSKMSPGFITVIYAYPEIRRHRRQISIYLFGDKKKSALEIFATDKVMVTVMMKTTVENKIDVIKKP